GVPVFLGIHRSQTLGPKAWLGSFDYHELAASIDIPKNTKKLSLWVQLEGIPARCPSISAALARTFGKPQNQPPTWLHWAIESTSETNLAPGLSAAEFLVDYSPLEALTEGRIKTIRPESITENGWRFRDKLVLLGDGTLG